MISRAVLLRVKPSPSLGAPTPGPGCKALRANHPEMSHFCSDKSSVSGWRQTQFLLPEGTLKHPVCCLNTAKILLLGLFFFLPPSHCLQSQRACLFSCYLSERFICDCLRGEKTLCSHRQTSSVLRNIMAGARGPICSPSCEVEGQLWSHPAAQDTTDQVWLNVKKTGSGWLGVVAGREIGNELFKACCRTGNFPVWRCQGCKHRHIYSPPEGREGRRLYFPCQLL